MTTELDEQTKRIISDLKAFLKAEQIKEDDFSLQYYGKDWTTYFKVDPSLIVFPYSTEEVQKIVLWARQHQVKLVPSGGRTGLSGGAVASEKEVILSLEKMNQVLSFSEVDQSLQVQAGVTTEEVQIQAHAKGFFYPIDFAARGSSQIGGNIATNAGGIKVLKYGLTRDWVLGIKVVTGQGEILDLNKGLTKNATGYDLRHLFIGSEGTLGIITEATLKLAPQPPPLKVLVLACPDLGSIMKIFSLFKKTLHLSAFEFFSNKALEKVISHKNFTAPFESSSPYYILIEAESPNEEEENKILESFEFGLNEGWVLDGVLSQSESQAKTLWKLREDISESLAPFGPYKNDIAVKISQVPSFINDLDELLVKVYPEWELIWFGHIGDGNLHINILKPPQLSKEDFFKECQKMDAMIFNLVKQYLGSVSAEHGVGMTKRPFLSFTRSQEEIEYLKIIKKAFDPDGILNPKKLI